MSTKTEDIMFVYSEDMTTCPYDGTRLDMKQSHPTFDKWSCKTCGRTIRFCEPDEGDEDDGNEED